jgi:hypothetical protein
MQGRAAVARLHVDADHRPFPLNLLAFSQRTGDLLRKGAWAWTSIRTPIFLALAFSEGVPESPERAIWEAPLQFVLLIIVDIGSLIAWRHAAVGATTITIGSVLLGALAAMQRQPLEGFPIATAFVIPGLLYWLDWQRTQPARKVILLALALALSLLVGGLAAFVMHSSYSGGDQPGILWDIARATWLR